MPQYVHMCPRLHSIQTDINKIRMEQNDLRISQSINGLNLDLISDKIEAMENACLHSARWYDLNHTVLSEQVKSIQQQLDRVNDQLRQQQLDRVNDQMRQLQGQQRAGDR